MKMSETLNKIRRRVGEENLTNSCGSSNCRVDTDNVPRERVVVNVDLAFEAHGGVGKHCDKILFYICPTENYLVVVLIEHKGGTFDSATEIAEQLQGGANFARDLIPDDINTTCVPILFHGSGSHQSQFIKLRRQQINFKGSKIPISKDRCGASKNLANVLSRAGILS
ncbi:MAG: hypothetical protein OXU23_05095 [Candidatus Poribacteria bacterium]|nr:hypothetical protein [Candidatus Poribacteria bacterium]MDE0315275.1 hypothetical protein [Candidatus Poribacteria bacterium]